MNQNDKKTFVHIFAFHTVSSKPLLAACALLCTLVLPWATPAMAHTDQHGPDHGITTHTTSAHVNPAYQNSDSPELLARGGGGRGQGKGRGNAYGQCDGTGSGQGKGNGPKDGTGTGQGAQDGTGPRSGTRDCPRNPSGDTGTAGAQE